MTKNFATGLLQCVKTSTDEALIKLASRALFYLIQTSKSYAVEIAEMVMTECKDWGDEKRKPTDQERLATLILMRDCALFTRQYFLRKANGYFNYIFKFIKEYKNHKEIACKSLHAALAVISQREHRQKNDWYEKCLNEARISSINVKEDVLASSLMIYNEIMRMGFVTAEKLRLNLENVTESTKNIADTNPVIWLLDETNPAIVESHTAQSLVINSINDIDRVVSEAYKRNYKSGKMWDVLLEIYPRLIGYYRLTHKDKTENKIEEKIVSELMLVAPKCSNVFRCVGLICLQQRVETTDILNDHMDTLVKSLNGMKSKFGARTLDEPVLKFLCCVIQSHPNAVLTKSKEILTALFNIGFSESIIEALHCFVKYLPELTAEVHDGLLDLLYRQLMNQQRPNKLAAPTPPPKPPTSDKLSVKSDDVPTMVLALKALGNFEFQRHSLQMFINYLAQVCFQLFLAVDILIVIGVFVLRSNRD